MKKTIFAISTLFALALASCSDFKVSTTEEGDRIQYHTKGDGETPNIGDVIILDLNLTDINDTTYRNTFKEGEPLKIPVVQGQFKGSFESALLHLSVGDSATVFVSVDSLYGTMQQPLPPNVNSGSDFKFLVAVRDIMTPEENSAALQKKKDDEDVLIKDYVSKSMEGAKPLGESGIYYITEKQGSGKEPARGDTVLVNYVGKLMSGKEFDANRSKTAPFSFPVGMGYVIKGWDTTLMSMKKGEKGTYIIPSSIGYGERGAGGSIPPFSPLVFEIELLDIKR